MALCSELDCTGQRWSFNVKDVPVVVSNKYACADFRTYVQEVSLWPVHAISLTTAFWVFYFLSYTVSLLAIKTSQHLRQVASINYYNVQFLTWTPLVIVMVEWTSPSQWSRSEKKSHDSLPNTYNHRRKTQWSCICSYRSLSTALSNVINPSIFPFLSLVLINVKRIKIKKRLTQNPSLFCKHQFWKTKDIFRAKRSRPHLVVNPPSSWTFRCQHVVRVSRHMSRPRVFG